MVVAEQADDDSEESVTIERPEPGTYSVEVVGYDVPAGMTSYDYRDVYVGSSLDSLEVDPTPLRMGAGDEATLEGSLVVEAAPAPGRGLVGRLVLSEAGGGVVGDAHVLARAVSAGSALAAGQVDAST